MGIHLAAMHPHEIRKAVQCNIKTVRLWIDRYEEGGDAALRDYRKNNKRPKKMTPE